MEMTTKTKIIIANCAIVAGLTYSALTGAEPRIIGIVGILLLVGANLLIVIKARRTRP
jgi:hypothetical protein